VDIGSNTVRLLVADVHEGRLRELMTQRAFVRLGKGMRRGGAIRVEKIAETAEAVATQVKGARELEPLTLTVVATAAVRDARNGDELLEAIERRTGLPVALLTEVEEARFAFVGATKTLASPVAGPVGVVDVGGGSSEIVVGTVAGGVTWSESFRIGSGFLTDSYVRCDPPSVGELNSMRSHIGGCFEGLDVPPTERAVAVGGSATSLRRLVGLELSHEALDRSIGLLASWPAEEIGRRFQVDPQRVRLLPAGVLILDELAQRLAGPLNIGNGGLREGVVIEMAAAAA
jgi:exopolyphosphatase/guanosine-5'-triphosphate,3'-diphosphate pyrophosphatase